MGIEDKEGKPLDGSKTYRLNVPANAPSGNTGRRRCTIGRPTRSFARVTRRPLPRRARDCRSTRTDRWICNFGPKAPEGKESNWTPTDPNGEFEILFRFYGPSFHHSSTRRGYCRMSNW